MRIELISPSVRSLPIPEYTLKHGERRMFYAEQDFLEAISRRTPDFGRYLSDLSSSQMAEQTMLAYGFSGGACHSGIVLGKRFGISDHSVDINIRVAVQSLWLLHKKDFPADLYGFAGFLTERYIDSPNQREGSHQRILKRAESNIAYYKDRLFVMEKEDEILALIEGLYGKKTRGTFTCYYRLGEYKDSESFERQGNFTFVAGTFQERIALEDVLEAGRATAEYVHSLEIGSTVWTSIKGVRRTGYRRKGRFFPSILEEYQGQIKVTEALKDPFVRRYLNDSSFELLGLTTQARLSGFSKKEGLDEFNTRRGARATLSDVKVLEGRAQAVFEKDRLVHLDRREKIKELMAEPSLRRKLARSLADIVYNYHIEGIKNRLLAEDLPVHWFMLSELRKLLDLQILKQQGFPSDELPKRGEISAEMIDSFFENDDLPPWLINLLGRIADSKDLPKLGQEVFPNRKQAEHGLSALRKLAVETVKEDHFLRETLK